MASWNTKTLEDPEAGLELQPEHQIFGQLQEVVVSSAPLAKKTASNCRYRGHVDRLGFLSDLAGSTGAISVVKDASIPIPPRPTSSALDKPACICSPARAATTHLDGPHGRIPLGFYRVGQLAISQQTFCYSEAIQDASAFPNQGWVLRDLIWTVSSAVGSKSTTRWPFWAGFTKCRLSESEKSGFFTLGKVIEAAFSLNKRETTSKQKRGETTSARIPLAEPLIDVDRENPASSLFVAFTRQPYRLFTRNEDGTGGPRKSSRDRRRRKTASKPVDPRGRRRDEFATILRCVLEKAGAQVRVVGNGMEAVLESQEAVDSERPFDLILMDMQMPIMDGDQATRRLRADGYRGSDLCPDGGNRRGGREKCLGCGCDAYLAKPLKTGQVDRPNPTMVQRSDSRSTSWEISFLRI